MNWIRRQWREQCGLAAICAMQRLDYKTATKWLRRAKWCAEPSNS